ncbi:tripartite tricarboxylate transporter substrate binding protein [Saccharomonospora sp. NPDC046836]|uniref:tripartite tricarboxylate transporter substrate binding protein n=1 Tax=Saccharomonospora sp. NPDC046836 TaxID=3156921 RepID=UPI0033E3E46E
MRFSPIPALSAAALLLTAGCSLTEAPASGEYPSRNISVIVPVPAGSSTDLSTRVLTPCLERELDTTVVVENREGGSGAVGNGVFARAEADGYTLVSTTAANAVLPPILEGDVGYDVDSFRPIGMIGTAPIVLVVPADSPFTTAEDFFAAAESGTVLLGIPGATSVPGISADALIATSGLGIEPVPFDGNGGTMTAVVSGEVQAGYLSADAGVVLPRIASGEVRALATAVTEPIETMPDVPTLESLGHTGLPYADSFWFLATQPGTPDDVVATLEDAMRTCMSSEEVKSSLGEGVAPSEFVAGAEVDELLHQAASDYAQGRG